MPRPYRLSCHCGSIRLEVDAEMKDLRQCNCSSCRRFGAIHWYVPTASVRLLDEKRPLSAYVWRAVHEAHKFCPTCGTSMLRTGYPEPVVAINAACIEEIDVFELEIEQFDGRTKIPPGVLP